MVLVADICSGQGFSILPRLSRQVGCLFLFRLVLHLIRLLLLCWWLLGLVLRSIVLLWVWGVGGVDVWRIVLLFFLLGVFVDVWFVSEIVG